MALFVARFVVGLSDSGVESFSSAADVVSVIPFIAIFFVNSLVFGRLRAEAGQPLSMDTAFRAFYALMAVGMIALIVGATKSYATQQDVSAYALRILGGVSLLGSLGFLVSSIFAKSIHVKPNVILARGAVVFSAAAVVESFAWLVGASSGHLFGVFLPLDVALFVAAAFMYSPASEIARKHQELNPVLPHAVA